MVIILTTFSKAGKHKMVVPLLVIIAIIIITIFVVVIIIVIITTTQRGRQARDGGRISGEDPLLRPEGSHRPCSQVDHGHHHPLYNQSYPLYIL